MSTENNKNENKFTNRDLWEVFLHQLTIGGTNNYEHQQNAGFTKTMMPVAEKYCEDPEEKKEAYIRHMEYFLTNDIISAIPVGAAAAMEEQYATEGDIDPDSINTVKTALMEPLAGLGDSFLNGAARPIPTGIAISLITAGFGWVGSIFFVAGMSIASLGVRYLGVFQGYEQDIRFVEKIQSNGLIGRISKLATITTYVTMGGFIPTFMVIPIPIVYRSSNTVFSIQGTLDGLVLGILGILYAGLMYLLTSKRKISTVKLVLVTMVVGIVGTYCDILGQDWRQEDDR